jgi:hypothetical protein
MKPLIAILIIVLLITTPSCKWLKKKGIIGKKARIEAEMKQQQKNARIADSLKKVQEQLLAIEKARLDSISKADQEKMEWENTNRYNIIIGSFITPEYARSYSAEFDARGYKTRLIKLEGTQFEMVSAEAHDNFRTAVERLKQFQDTVAYDAWLYIYRKN